MKKVECAEARIIHRPRSEEKANLLSSRWKSPKREPAEKTSRLHPPNGRNRKGPAR